MRIRLRSRPSRSIHRRFTRAVLAAMPAALALAPPLRAQGAGAAVDSAARALVAGTRVLASRDEVRVIFPPDPAAGRGWGQASAGEQTFYRWSVGAQGLDNDYAISVFVNAERNGVRWATSLDALVAGGNAAFCIPDVGFIVCPPGTASARVEGGRVVLALRDRASIDRLLKLRPERVAVSHGRPGLSPVGVSDSVRVEYLDAHFPAPTARMLAQADSMRRWRRRQGEVVSRGIGKAYSWGPPPLWLVVGDTVTVGAEEERCSYDVCYERRMSEGQWSVSDTSILRSIPPQTDPVRPSTGFPPRYRLVGLRPGRVRVTVTGLPVHPDTAELREAPPTEVTRGVVVSPPVARVEISPRPTAARRNERLELRATAFDAEGRAIEGAPVSFRVHLDGERLDAGGSQPTRFHTVKPGRYEIVASFAGATDTLVVTVP